MLKICSFILPPPQIGNYHRIVFTVMILLYGNLLFGQNTIKPEVINYPQNVYNAESQNWSASQDENGILYFANNKGLLVFNGEEWNAYELPQQQIVRSVAADGKGKIYTGAYGELGYWTKNRLGTYRYHSLDNLVKDSLFKNEEIWKIIVSPNEVLFQSFSRIYLLQNGQMKTLEPPGVIMFVFMIRGKYYVDVLQKGIYLIDDNYNFVPVTQSPAISTFKVNFILPYSDNKLLVGTEKNGIYLFDGKDYQRFPAESENYLKENVINNGIQINDNLFAIGTISGGIVFIDAQGKTIGGANKKANGLQNNTILNLFKDADGNCWATLDRGISLLSLNSDIEYFSDVQGNLGAVYSMAVYQNYLYAATNHGLFRAPFRTLDDFDENTLQPFHGIANQVWDLKVIDGKLFCGCNSGTWLIDGNAVTNLSSFTGGWDMEQVKNHPELLLQGTYNGIAVYKKTSGNWHLQGFMSGTENLPVNKLRLDSRGFIWVSHAYKGVFVIQPSADFNKAIQIKELTDAGGGRLSFFQYGDEVLANNTTGIYRYDFAQDKLQPATDVQKIFGEYFYTQTIIPDSGKGFWFINSSDETAYKNLQTGDVHRFTFNPKNFNLIPLYENIIACNAQQSFVCGEGGFAVINKNQSNQPEAAPVITELLAAKKDNFTYIDSAYFTGANAVELPYSENSIVFHFSQLAYSKDVRYRFSFTKNGQPVWSEWTNTPVKEFDNLAPGKYVFQLKSNLSDSVAVFYVTIDEAWFWSPVSKAVYLLVWALSTYLLLRWHSHRLAKQKLQMTIKMKEEISLQRQKNENEILRLKEVQLSAEVVNKSEDLAKLAMDLIEKKNVLKKLKEKLESVRQLRQLEEIRQEVQKISKSLDMHVENEENEWHLFDNGFNKVHEEFFQKLLQAYPDLTAQDLRLAAYLKMNLSTKEIAPLFNISTRGVEIKRYRLRKKMQLPEHENLNDFMIRLK